MLLTVGREASAPPSAHPSPLSSLANLPPQHVGCLNADPTQHAAAAAAVGRGVLWESGPAWNNNMLKGQDGMDPKY
eukprot:1154988-Pelagomonas_calceolata.AAC.1